jgi:hypothetical protein
VIKRATQLQIGDLVYLDGTHWIMDGFAFSGKFFWLSPDRNNKELVRLISTKSKLLLSVYAREALDG